MLIIEKMFKKQCKTKQSSDLAAAIQERAVRRSTEFTSEKIR